MAEIIHLHPLSGGQQGVDLEPGGEAGARWKFTRISAVFILVFLVIAAALSIALGGKIH